MRAGYVPQEEQQVYVSRGTAVSITDTRFHSVLLLLLARDVMVTAGVCVNMRAEVQKKTSSIPLSCMDLSCLVARSSAKTCPSAQALTSPAQVGSWWDCAWLFGML